MILARDTGRGEEEVEEVATRRKRSMIRKGTQTLCESECMIYGSLKIKMKFHVRVEN
jgi:hypothetical protein